ncbi:metal-dependent hydrolase [Sphingobacterium wenxiniae]|uniref:L-ascorbate metabolism protein UlaG, beta-lactamase superfamily n=1 Tax=Sphingobacterium wenxiniae TaxID=683125 RepID=A0A1I6V2R7_9SPHI|nr:metal-dependent hydrolase [Sphingobacterium wenxiniae]SFT07964.1 L-ascorbate metabolism protein UlaG, beta-lactamase superfamily [Sphingobacterium wenxiniae]
MANQISVRYLGHARFEFNFNGTKVLTDPFITYNPLAKDINVSELSPDYIMLSHAHEDHVADLANIQQQSGATVAAIVETANWVRRQGVPEDKVIEFNFGGTLNLPFGKVKMVYALHTNSTPDGAYGGVPCGFVFFVGDKKIYFAGDTALTLEMKLLEDLQLDWAFLPIGGHYTMDMYDAVKAANFIQCDNIIGMHYDTFSPVTIDTAEARRIFQDAGLNLNLLALGESIAL